MKETKHDPKFQKFVLETVEKLRLALNLHNYRVKVHFVDKVQGYSHIPSQDPGGYSAETQSDHVYMDIDIWVSRVLEKKFRDGNLSIIIEDLCHELLHSILDAYYVFANDRIRNTSDEKKRLINLDENTVQRITVILMKHIKLTK